MAKQYSKVVGVVIRLAGGFSIVENPVNNNLQLQISHKTREDFILQISDISGKVINERKLNCGIGLYTLNIGGLARGEYLVMLSSGNWKQVKRFIKQ
ncbi:MAG: T9SS type A sorting domain-containing protein [Ginsengibacter sp.]